MIILLAVLYLFPAILSLLLNRKHWAAILVLNLFLGWTYIGWVAALIWVFADKKGN